MASWAQPEDKMRSDMGRVMLAQAVRYRDFWRPLSVKTSASANHEEMASCLAVFDRYAPGIAWLKQRLANSANDFLRRETMADAPHYGFSLEAMMFQRKYARRDGDTALANTVNECILQWWAQIALCADQLDHPERCEFGWAHQRSVAPTGGTTVCDYYWRRGLGQSHSGTGLVNLGDRSGDFQEPFTPHLHADYYLTDLKLDVGQIISAYRAGGFPAVAKFIRRGSKGTWHWLRFDNGGYLSVLEHDYGVDEARHVAMRQSAGSPLLQFPEGTVGRRLYRESGATLDAHAGTIKAWDDIYGRFSQTFDPKSITLWVTSSPAGVATEVGASTFQPEEPGDEEDTLDPSPLTPPEGIDLETPRKPRHGGCVSFAGLLILIYLAAWGAALLAGGFL